MITTRLVALVRWTSHPYVSFREERTVVDEAAEVRPGGANLSTHIDRALVFRYRLDFACASAVLKAGGRVRREAWAPDHGLTSDGEVIIAHGLNGLRAVWSPDTRDLLADDWMVVP